MAVRRHNRRSAFTLFEIVIAVALTGIVMVLIGGAIDFHLRQLTVRRTRIEEAQLARAVLRRIADDLRAIVVLPPSDSAMHQSSIDAGSSTSGETTGSATGPTGGSTGGPTSGSSIGGAIGGSSAGRNTTGQSSATGSGAPSTGTSDDMASLVPPPSTPGLFGSQFQLQIDISRIPRYEEYQLMADFADPTQIGSLSEMKNVTYFVFGTPGAGGTAGPLSGLVRRVVSRAAARWAIENGSYELLDENSELIAPEISAIQFAYFDGFQWYSEWDSELMGGIPMAVEIILSVQNDPNLPASIDDLRNQLASGGAVYRMVVRLPAAELIESQTTDQSSTSATSGL
jgi:hypothetical protein